MIDLRQGDCLEVLQEYIESNKRVDCIITSPPYNMNLRVLKGKYVSRTRNKNYKNEFSTKYNNYTDDMPMEEYFEFQDKFIEMALDVSDIVFYNIQFITGNKVALLRLLGKYAEKIKEIIIWDKINSQPAMMDKVLNSQYEFIIVFENSKPYNRKFNKCNFERGKETNVWQIKSRKNQYIKASFPEELIKRIVTNFTDENDTVLDPFMGSGTTGIVCKNLNRNFIGIELDENYYKIACERINNTQEKVN